MSQDGAMLRVAGVADTCTTLGPGVRAVVWVQGCERGCPGCIAPEKQNPSGGYNIPVEDIAAHISSLIPIEGVTLSGGEPFLQSGPLALLIKLIQRRRPLSIMAYTGFTLQYLREFGKADQKDLLAHLDILVDGPFIIERATAKRWRGSDNQCVHFLTPRYARLADQLDDDTFCLDVQVGKDGTVIWMGIPPPGFRERFEKGLGLRQIRLKCLS